VENNPAIRWCPEAGCERAVRLSGRGTADPLGFPRLRAPAVDCGKGHLFCWSVAGTTPPGDISGVLCVGVIARLKIY